MSQGRPNVNAICPVGWWRRLCRPGGGQPFQFDLPPFPTDRIRPCSGLLVRPGGLQRKGEQRRGRAARAESAAASHVHVLGSGNTIKTVPPVLRLGCVNVSVSPAHDLAEESSLSVTAAS